MPPLVTGDVVKEQFPKIAEQGTTKLEDADKALERYDGGTTTVVIEIEYRYAQVGGVTPPCARCIGAVFGAFGSMPIGTVAVRTIRGTSTWSQHAYGNAVDFMCAGEKHRQVAYFVNANRGALDVAHLLADPYFPSPLGDHYNHVHVDFYPQWCGTPPGHPC
jgi:hypothetical protein